MVNSHDELNEKQIVIFATWKKTLKLFDKNILIYSQYLINQQSSKTNRNNKSN